MNNKVLNGKQEGMKMKTLKDNKGYEYSFAVKWFDNLESRNISRGFHSLEIAFEFFKEMVEKGNIVNLRTLWNTFY